LVLREQMVALLITCCIVFHHPETCHLASAVVLLRVMTTVCNL